MPKTTTFNIIFWLVFSHSIASGTLDINQSILDDAAGQINTAEAEIQAQINLLISDLKSSHDHLAYGLSEYCGIEENDPSCAGKDQITIASENSVIIDKMMWGFVLNGDESDTDYEDLIQGQPVNYYNAPFDQVSPTQTAFKNHLCLEVNFKDTNEIEFALPFYTGKTIVLCAVSSSDDGSLVHIDYVDSDLSDGYGDETHVIIPSGPGGWRCYNPHQQLGNGGAGFGYDFNPVNNSATQIGRINTGFLYNCQQVNQNTLET